VYRNAVIDVNETVVAFAFDVTNNDQDKTFWSITRLQVKR